MKTTAITTKSSMPTASTVLLTVMQAAVSCLLTLILEGCEAGEYSNIGEPAYTFVYNGIEYSATESTSASVTVTGYSHIEAGSILELPSTVNDGSQEYRVTAIGRNALAHASMAEVVIPETVTRIQEHAFVHCTNLTTVWCLGSEPPMLADDGFDQYTYSNATLRAPNVQAYAGADGWSRFDRIRIRYNLTESSRLHVLQKHTCGKGVAVFLITDIKDVAQDTIWSEMMHGLFNRQPAASLRDCFDIYGVDATGLDLKVTITDRNTYASDFSYTDLVKSMVDLEPLQYHVTVVAVSPDNGRARSCARMGSAASTALCYWDTNRTNTVYRTYLIEHEVIGHCIGRLNDEYIEYQEGAPKSYITRLKTGHKQNWYMNVDTDPENNPVWNSLKQIPEYREALGDPVQGAWYRYGVWRSSGANNPMDGTITDFNAVSRWLIYEHILEYAGEEASLDAFVEMERSYRNTLHTQAPPKICTMPAEFMPATPVETDL